jgi:hypothetical protein
MKAIDMSFAKIIDSEPAKDHFHVPMYQRGYSWGADQWEQLTMDIDDEPEYFMGSILCLNKHDQAPPGSEHFYEVVDGQQRLMTLSLLLMAIHHQLKRRLDAGSGFKDDDERKRAEWVRTNLQAKLIKKRQDPDPTEKPDFLVGQASCYLRVRPSIQSHNHEDFRYALCQAGVLKDQPRPDNFHTRKIFKAFTYFRDKYLKEKDVAFLCDLVGKINQLGFVHITVNNQADAFTLFESLNNRGLPLSAIDIIKNQLLSKLEKKLASEESFERWQNDVIDALPNAPDQERFLRHFYNAFRDYGPKLRLKDAPSRATRSQIIKIYGGLIDPKPGTQSLDVTELFEEFTKKAKLYAELSHPPLDYADESLRRGLAELERIGASPAYQILLLLFSVPKERLRPDDFLVRAVDLLCRYYVRRNVTNDPPTRDLDAAAIEVIDGCVKKIDESRCLDFDTFASLLMLKGKPSAVDKFRSALEGPIYDENVGMARYLLIQLNGLFGTKESPDLWGRDKKGGFIWTVEHVLPQTKNLSDEWRQMIASDIQEDCRNSLGNLTLSGYNSNLATAFFKEKQGKENNGKKIGYQNGLALNNLPFNVNGARYSLADAPKWTEELIEARRDAMVKLLIEANKLLGFDGE